MVKTSYEARGDGLRVAGTEGEVGGGPVGFRSRVRGRGAGEILPRRRGLPGMPAKATLRKGGMARSDESPDSLAFTPLPAPHLPRLQSLICHSPAPTRKCEALIYSGKAHHTARSARQGTGLPAMQGS